MRVSIVATALDGQQPESKSVINMVHRIQNRNPGYSDFSNNITNQSFSFSNQNNSIMTNGANALKFEEEEKAETGSQEASVTSSSEEVISSAIVEEEVNSVEDQISKVDEHPKEKQETETFPSNGLENFNFDEETPELFNSNGETEDQTSLTPEISETKEEEDDLEIPAFLRRQKN